MYNDESLSVYCAFQHVAVAAWDTKALTLAAEWGSHTCRRRLQRTYTDLVKNVSVTAYHIPLFAICYEFKFVATLNSDFCTQHRIME
jgi:hypothetical protein